MGLRLDFLCLDLVSSSGLGQACKRHNASLVIWSTSPSFICPFHIKYLIPVFEEMTVQSTLSTSTSSSMHTPQTSSILYGLLKWWSSISTTHNLWTDGESYLSALKIEWKCFRHGCRWYQLRRRNGIHSGIFINILLIIRLGLALASRVFHWWESSDADVGPNWRSIIFS